ncbi:hypothetical protein VTO42DRAFT_7652 [Malbranchea cinnamomea]
MAYERMCLVQPEGVGVSCCYSDTTTPYIQYGLHTRRCTRFHNTVASSSREHQRKYPSSCQSCLLTILAQTYRVVKPSSPMLIAQTAEWCVSSVLVNIALPRLAGTLIAKPIILARVSSCRVPKQSIGNIPR